MLTAISGVEASDRKLVLLQNPLCRKAWFFAGFAVWDAVRQSAMQL